MIIKTPPTRRVAAIPKHPFFVVLVIAMVLAALAAGIAYASLGSQSHMCPVVTVATARC